MKNNTVHISVKLKKKTKIIISVKLKKIKNNNKKNISVKLRYHVYLSPLYPQPQKSLIIRGAPRKLFSGGQQMKKKKFSR